MTCYIWCMHAAGDALADDGNPVRSSNARVGTAFVRKLCVAGTSLVNRYTMIVDSCVRVCVC